MVLIMATTLFTSACKSTAGARTRSDQKLGVALAQHTGEEESEKIRHLYQRLAILLVKGNAALFLNRLPSHPSPMIDGSE
jgi:hypothetical protein